jgi:hypothetical protein
MEEHNVLDRLERVKAPAGFERRVLAELSVRKGRRVRVHWIQRVAWAGSAAAVLVVFGVIGALFLNRPDTAVRAALDSRVVPVMETVDYSSEVRNASYEPQTIYILEQVSEASPSGISY